MGSQFKLKHEKGYSCRPNLVHYFMPMTDAEFQERLDRHKGEVALMTRSSQFNQDKTALIVTNNSLPLLISDQQFTTPFDFFSEELLEKVLSGHKPICLPPLEEPQKQMVGVNMRKPGIPVPFRFANTSDFKSEGKFSKMYTEKKLLRMYPQLRTRWFPSLDSKKKEPHPSIECWAPRMTEQWEPLTLECLENMKPTLTAPGDDGFRYGKAPLWVINSSVAMNRDK